MSKTNLFISIILWLILYVCISSFRPSVRDCVDSTARSQVGVRELTGKNDGKEVEAYLAVTGQKKGAAWCAAFVCWTYQSNGVPHSKSAWSPSLFPTQRVVWKKGENNTYTPQKGDAFGIYFPDKKRVAHVGLIAEWHTDFVLCCEGNTSDVNTGEATREGQGVYLKRRPKRQIYIVSNWIDKN